MNHNRVTLDCGRCRRPAVVIISDASYCSAHGLEATLAQAPSVSLVVDLRDALSSTFELDAPAVVSLAG